LTTSSGHLSVLLSRIPPHSVAAFSQDVAGFELILVGMFPFRLTLFFIMPDIFIQTSVCMSSDVFLCIFTVQSHSQNRFCEAFLLLMIWLSPNGFMQKIILTSKLDD
jgi:hypothetical protein